MVMKSHTLQRYVEPLLTPRLAHVTSIRMGTKALAHWPDRFTRDADAADVLHRFEQVRESGRARSSRRPTVG
jgi:L-lysine 2,3-aminomutase